jgi:hypothetical protein
MEEEDDIESTCSKCNKTFCSNKTLQKHLEKKIPCDRKIKCDKCGKTFGDITQLKRHSENRKTPCEAIVGNVPPVIRKDDIKCQFCGRTFTTEARLNNHIDKCKIATNKKVFHEGNMVRGEEALYAVIKDELRETRKQFNMAMEAIANKPTNTTIVNNNIENTFNIMVNNFDGIQRTDHIGYEDLIKVLGGDLPQIVPTVTQLIHGNENIKENHNIRLVHDSILVLENEGDTKVWRCRTVADVYNVLLRRCMTAIKNADLQIKRDESKNYSMTQERKNWASLQKKLKEQAFDDTDINCLKDVLKKLPTSGR